MVLGQLKGRGRLFEVLAKASTLISWLVDYLGGWTNVIGEDRTLECHSNKGVSQLHREEIVLTIPGIILKNWADLPQEAGRAGAKIKMNINYRHKNLMSRLEE